jgi:transposase
LRVEVDGQHFRRAQPQGRQAVQARSAANVDNALAGQVAAAQQPAQSLFCFRDLRLAYAFRVIGPVFAEGEVVFRRRQVLMCHQGRLALILRILPCIMRMAAASRKSIPIAASMRSASACCASMASCVSA